MTDSLKGKLQSARWTFEWPPNQNRYFIPRSTLDDLMTPEAVSKELQEDFTSLDPKLIAQYAEVICAKATKLYAILLCGNKGDTICQFLKDSMTDEDLPFQRPDIREPFSANLLASTFKLCSSKHIETCLKPNHTGCGIEALSKWSVNDLRMLSRDQWQVLIPTFHPRSNGKIPHTDFDENTIFPFVEDHLYLHVSPPRYGGYSHVWGVRIHWAHQTMYESSDPNNHQPLLAIKRPFSRDIRDFKKEANMLSTLALRQHPHLVKLLATYKYKDDYHFVFPYANANLRGYWNDTGVPYRNQHTYLWFMQQICGLTSGVNAIHNFKPKEEHVPDKVKAAPNLRISVGEYLTVAPEEKKYGRHGDIKPENILWSNELKESQGEEGILQLTDMGCGRFHRLESRSGIDARGISGSPTYAPPEVQLEKSISRSYDIWSLGCVFVEFVTWLVEGSEMVYEFASERNLEVRKDEFDDLYYQIVESPNGSKSAVVRDGVTNWFDRLRQHDRCSNMLRDVLDLVQYRMLVIDASSRIYCHDLVQELESIIARARGDNFYLLGDVVKSNDPDSGVKLPRGQNTKYAPTSTTQTGADLDSDMADPDPNLPGIVLSFHNEGMQEETNLQSSSISRRLISPDIYSWSEPPMRTSSFPEVPMPRTSKPSSTKLVT